MAVVRWLLCLFSGSCVVLSGGLGEVSSDHSVF